MRRQKEARHQRLFGCFYSRKKRMRRELETNYTPRRYRGNLSGSTVAFCKLDLAARADWLAACTVYPQPV